MLNLRRLVLKTLKFAVPIGLCSHPTNTIQRVSRDACIFLTLPLPHRPPSFCLSVDVCFLILILSLQIGDTVILVDCKQKSKRKKHKLLTIVRKMPRLDDL